MLHVEAPVLTEHPTTRTEEGDMLDIRDMRLLSPHRSLRIFRDSRFEQALDARSRSNCWTTRRVQFISRLSRGVEHKFRVSPDRERDEFFDFFAAGRPSPIRVVRKTLEMNNQHRRQTPQLKQLVGTSVLLAKR